VNKFIVTVPDCGLQEFSTLKEAKEAALNLVEQTSQDTATVLECTVVGEAVWASIPSVSWKGH